MQSLAPQGPHAPHRRGAVRIEQLQTRTPILRIDLSGDWTGKGASAKHASQAGHRQRRFRARCWPGFGMGSRLGGGEGTMTFDAGLGRASRCDSSSTSLEGSLQARCARRSACWRSRPVRSACSGHAQPRAAAAAPDLSTSATSVSKGFAFNEITGRVHFGNGQARSDKLVIDGPCREHRHQRAPANLHRAKFTTRPSKYGRRTGNLLTCDRRGGGRPGRGGHWRGRRMSCSTSRWARWRQDYRA
jgi:hypothetical protein